MPTQAQIEGWKKAAITRWGKTKLTDEQILEVFQLRIADRQRWTLHTLAARFEVHWMYIQNVIKGEIRKDAYANHPHRLACIAEELRRRDLWRKRHSALHNRLYDRGVRDYQAGMSLRKAAARHDLWFPALGRELKRRGIARRPPGAPRKKAKRRSR